MSRNYILHRDKINSQSAILTLDDVVDFTWMFGNTFFLEAGKKGNYLWLDPDYGGDNIIVKTEMTYKEYCEKIGPEFGRDKGSHIIRDYCGDEVKILGE
jgi:hypothetical protein